MGLFSIQNVKLELLTEERAIPVPVSYHGEHSLPARILIHMDVVEQAIIQLKNCGPKTIKLFHNKDILVMETIV
jgi:hypothetical protein